MHVRVTAAAAAACTLARLAALLSERQRVDMLERGKGERAGGAGRFGFVGWISAELPAERRGNDSAKRNDAPSGKKRARGTTFARQISLLHLTSISAAIESLS